MRGGFSLVESIIAVFIVGIMLTLGSDFLARSAKFQQQSATSQAADSAAEALLGDWANRPFGQLSDGQTTMQNETINGITYNESLRVGNVTDFTTGQALAVRVQVSWQGASYSTASNSTSLEKWIFKP